jgi:radical SAM superfamily enzyme
LGSIKKINSVSKGGCLFCASLSIEIKGSSTTSQTICDLILVAQNKTNN